VETWHSRRAARYGRSPWSTRACRRSLSKVSVSSWSTRTTCSSGKSRSSVRPTLSTKADISRYPAVPPVLFTVHAYVRACVFTRVAPSNGEYRRRNSMCYSRPIRVSSWLCRTRLRRVSFPFRFRSVVNCIKILIRFSRSFYLDNGVLLAHVS